MKSYYILLVAAAALLSSASGISLTQDGGTSTVVKRSLHTFDGVQVNGDSGRFLRSYTERDDSGDPADEERGTDASVRTWVSKFIANGAEELPATLTRKELDSIISKLIAEKNTLFKGIAQDGITPDSMYTKLNIQHKLETFTDAQLAADDDFILFLHYEIYWNKAHGNKIFTWLNKRIGSFGRKAEE